MLPVDWLYEAHERILPHITNTPLTFDSNLNIYIKWENKQITGSFKARGALNKVLSLQPWERAKGIVAASAGNHGQGVALAGKLTSSKITVFIPEQAPQVKVKAIQEFGADIRLIRGGYAAAEEEGKLYATQTKSIWISPYNDSQVIAGQGTIALEILKELRESDEMSWVVPVSGGGLIAGIASVLELSAPRCRLIGVQSETSPFLYSIFKYGTQEGISELPTIAEGLAGAVENNSITIPIIRRNVNDILLVSEEEIKQAIAYCWYKYGERIEGAAAVSLAAILKDQIRNKPAILIISGGNIQSELHQHVISNYSY